MAVAILGTLALSSGPLLTGGKAQAAASEKAVVEFTQPVKLLNLFLRGAYTIIHDDSRMAQGEPCFYIYGNAEPDKLVISFHCTPVAKDKVERFTVRTSRSTWFDVPEVHEIQFAGSTTAHRVP